MTITSNSGRKPANIKLKAIFVRPSLVLASALSALVLGAEAVKAQPLVTFPFDNSADGNSGLNPSAFDSAILSSATVSAGPGLGLFSVGTDSWSGSVEVLKTAPSTTVAGATAADALANNWYFTISLTPNSSMDIGSIELDWSRGGTSGDRGWFLRSSLDAFAADLYAVDTPAGTPTGLQHVNVSLSGFTGITNTTDFRFYIYTPAPSRYMDFQNVSFLPPSSASSSVPGPLPLMGVGVAFAFSRRLRRRLHAVR